MAEKGKRRAVRGTRTAQKRRDARLDDHAGFAIADWRQKHDPPLVQADLAVVLGCSRTRISRIETGEQPMKVHEMIRLIQEYHTSFETILGLPWDRPWRPRRLGADGPGASVGQGNRRGIFPVEDTPTCQDSPNRETIFLA